MANLKTMYPGVANSPDTFLKEDLDKNAAVMYLSDGSVLGTLPTLAVISEEKEAETIKVISARADGGFTIERGVEGTQRAWKKADLVARNWTNKDYEAIRENIEAVNVEVSVKVDRVSGKGLSTNDYTDEAKAKVDAIPANPKYTDTVPDLSPYAKKTDLPTKLSQLAEDSEHRTVTDAEKAKLQSAPDMSAYAKKSDLVDKVVGVTEDEYEKLESDGTVEADIIYFVYGG